MSIKDEAGTIIGNVEGGSILNEAPWQDWSKLTLPTDEREAATGPALINAGLLPSAMQLLVQKVTAT